MRSRKHFCQSSGDAGTPRDDEGNIDYHARFKRYFTPSNFDPPREKVIPQISNNSYNRLNTSYRTQRQKSETTNMNTLPPKEFTAPIRLKTKITMTNTTDYLASPVDDLRNRRKLDEFMKKQELRKTYHWDKKDQTPPARVSHIYNGPNKHTKVKKELPFYIDRNETKSVQLRNQSIKQKLTIRREQELEKEMEDKLYLRRSTEVNRKMSPFINLAKSLEEPSSKVVNEFPNDSDSFLRKSIDEINEVPPIAYREGLFVEVQSEINKIIKKNQQEGEKEEKRKIESRGKYKTLCYRYWNPDINDQSVLSYEI